jgi:hypothetical protein
MTTHMARWVNLHRIREVFSEFGLEVPQSYVEDNGAYAANIRNHVAIRRGARAGETFALMCARHHNEWLYYHNPYGPGL